MKNSPPNLKKDCKTPPLQSPLGLYQRPPYGQLSAVAMLKDMLEHHALARETHGVFIYVLTCRNIFFFLFRCIFIFLFLFICETKT